MRELSLLLFRRGLIKFGEFKLSSGMISPFYIDLRGLLNYPDDLKKVAKMMLDLLSLKTDFDVIAGVATGGIPLAAYMSFISNKPMAYVRAEKKGHGTLRLVEGDVASRNVVLVDDVATTGESLERCALALRDHNAYIYYAAVVVDREQGAKEKLERVGVTLLSLTTARDIFWDLYDMRLIDRATFEKIISYIEKCKV